MDPKEIQWDSINWINVAGSTKHDNEPSGSIKYRVFSDWLRNQQILNKHYSPCSSLDKERYST